jgi:hypothetical protein
MKGNVIIELTREEANSYIKHNTMKLMVEGWQSLKDYAETYPIHAKILSSIKEQLK